MYKVLDPISGCNTARMYRVTRHGELIALFVSYAEAMCYISTRN